MAKAFFLGAVSNAVGTVMVDYLVKPVDCSIRYLFRLNKIVEELQEQEEKLTREQTRVQEDVNEAKRHIETQVIEKYVEDWLTDAVKALNDVQSLKNEMKENKKCFSWCPNWCCRYGLSKNMEKKALAIKKLVESSKFERYGHRAELIGLAFIKTKGFIASKSSVKAFNEIMEALKDDGVNMIGVWGMGGLGKTTLVKEAGKSAKELLGYKPIIVSVSQNPDIEKIRQTIADFLNLKFETKYEDGKAAELCLRLKNEEKVLIILDDMWNELDLEMIGIPVHENGKGCKIILTTRNRSVCKHMESQVTVSLGGFSEDEAWTLFEMKAALDDAAPDIIDVAKEIVEECRRLPIAIVTLARALRNKDLNGWELARDQLKRDASLIDTEQIAKEVDMNAYMCLEMSYNYLQSETTKRCFLLCALYPEDYSINVEDLVRYAWGLRLYPDARSIQDVRRNVFGAINTLKDSCLLIEDDEERYVP
ncbi:hypothetical protein PTKIN_Ptkin14bG0192100 [Pterospermum kingtungense]